MGDSNSIVKFFSKITIKERESRASGTGVV